MRIGITFTLRSAAGPTGDGPDDLEEEFDSPETIDAIATVLRSLGHEVEFLGDGAPLVRRLIDGPRPELVFNFAEGRGVGRSREARVPALLEMLGISYTASDPLTLAVTLDKDCAKRLAQSHGVATPPWQLVERKGADFRSLLRQFPLPAIVKPAYEGSSKGVRGTSLCRSQQELFERVDEQQRLYQQPILVEEYIDGDEVTVGLVGNPPEVLGIMKIIPRRAAGAFVYSLEVKRDFENQVQYECPAQLAPGLENAVRQAALAAWNALGCRDVARLDFRLRGDVAYFLEVNPLPGLAPKTSDLVIMSRLQGISYDDLIGRILRAALDRVQPS